MRFLNKELLNGGLSLLRAEKDKICVTIIVPTHRLCSQNRIDRLIVRRIFLKAKSELLANYSFGQISTLLSTINDLYEQIDYNHKEEGFGFYLSPDIKMQMQFSFPVTEKVFVGKKFLIRDALFQLSYSVPYYLLHLTEKKAQLFEGRIKDLTEVENEHFPFFNEDDYEYSRPARGSSYTGNAFLQGFEKDPSVIAELRNQAFLKKVDHQLKNFHIDNLPLVICGELKEVAYFKEITTYKKVISNFLIGNYQHLNRKEMGDLFWPVVKLDLDEQRNLLINQFKEWIGSGQTEEGIVNIWQATKEGKAFRLLVEKDYSVSGFWDSISDMLYLEKPELPCVILPDAVEEIMDRVLDQKGEVIFVENGKLEDFQHIALFTRY